MTNSGITVDDKKVLSALYNLSFKKMNKAYKDALTKSLQPILKQSKINLRKSGIHGVNDKFVSKKTGKTYKSMIQGVKTSVYVGNKDDESYGKVHIMGEFRLKWFEKGTSLRKTTRKGERGYIKPHWFFRDAVLTKGKIATQTLDENIKESILRAWEKQNK